VRILASRSLLSMVPPQPVFPFAVSKSRALRLSFLTFKKTVHRFSSTYSSKMRFSLAIAAFAPVLSVYGANILVQVGAAGQLAFSPTNITAQVGDTVAFQFQGKNHSVTQSTFANPCAIMTTPAQGIDSGFQFVPANATQLPEWSFTVNNASAPLWFFCAQTNPSSHCEAGMVFSVNADPNSAKSFAVYQAAAKAGNGAAAAASGVASAAGAAASGVASIAGAAASDAGSAISGATSAIASAAGAAATDAANALTSIAAGGAAALTGSGSASPSSTGNSTTSPSSAGRVTTSAVSMLAVVGRTALLL